MSNWSTGQTEVVEVTIKTRNGNFDHIITQRYNVPTGSAYQAKIIAEGQYGAGSVLGFNIVDKF